MKVLLRLFAVAVVAAGIGGCNNTPTSPSASVPFSQTDLVVGTGADAVTGKLVSVNYNGWLYDGSKTDGKGTQFASSVGVTTPFTFTLGAGQIIAGWERGVPGMKVGGTRRLVIPPSLAYGGTRNGPIPPNATLVFEIEVVDVQ